MSLRLSIVLFLWLILVSAATAHATSAAPAVQITPAPTITLSTNTGAVFLPLIRGGGAFQPPTPTPSPTPTPTAPAQADGVQIADFPRIHRRTERVDDAQVRIVYEVYNNVGRDISEFALTASVEAAAGTVDPVSAAAQPPALFDAAQAPGPDDASCTFALASGQTLPAYAAATLTCTYSESANSMVLTNDSIQPAPFIADTNYNQIHDLLEQQIDGAGNDLITVGVMLQRAVTPADLDAFTTAGGTVQDEAPLIDGFYGALPADQVERYRNSAAAVAFIEPNLQVEAHLSVATRNVRADRIWSGDPSGRTTIVSDTIESITGDPQTTIAIGDTGLDRNHPGITNARITAWRNTDGCGNAAPYNQATDWSGHGSHVAGIATGGGGGVTGGLDLRGIAHGANVLSIRYPGPSPFVMGPGGVNTLVVNGLDWLRPQVGAPFNVIVLNQSFGSPNPSALWETATRRFVEAGVVSVVSAGNSWQTNPTGSTVTSPAREPKVLTVGAVNNADSMANFSSNGPGAGGVIKPDVVAPGVAIQSIDADSRREDFRDLNCNGVYNGGDRCVDANGNREFDLNQDFFVDLAPYNGVRDPGESFANLNGVAGYQGGGDYCQDTHQPGVAPAALSGEFYFDRDGNGAHTAADRSGAPRDYVSLSGTSMAAPVVSGEVALVIDAMTDYDAIQEDGDGATDEDRWNGIDDDKDDIIDEDRGQWVYSEANARLVKSLVLMNTFEVASGATIPNPAGGTFSNAPGDANNDGTTDNYDRGGKDNKEGYGRVAIDAAVESVLSPFCGYANDSFGSGAADKHVWARHMHLYAGKEYKVLLDGPAGADFDIYLYQGLPNVNGEPVLARRPAPANSAISATTNSADENMTFQVRQSGLYFLVVRRVTGAGNFTVRLVTPEQWTVMLYMPAELAGAESLDDQVWQAVNDLEATGSGEESMQDMQVLALVDYDTRAWDGKDGSASSPGSTGAPDHRGDAVLYCVRKDHRLDASDFSVALQPSEVLSVTTTANDVRAEANMGAPTTLQNFAKWSVDHFPAKHYSLIVWGDGRGYGWKVNPGKALGQGNDTKRSVAAAADAEFDALEMRELRSAIAEVQKKINAGSQYKTGTGKAGLLDLLGFDMGHMALIDVAHQVQEYVEVMVASEERIELKGWPYKEWLAGLACARGAQNRLGYAWNCAAPRAVDAEALGTRAVDTYHTFYTTAPNADPLHTLSAIRLNLKPDTSVVDPCDFFTALVDCVSSFGVELRAGVEDVLGRDDHTDNVQIKIKHEGRELSDEMDDHNYIDLRDFAKKIRVSSVPATYKTQAPDIDNALRLGGNVIIANKVGSAHVNAHGLTIYYPHDQLLPEDANCKDAPDRGDRTCGFDSPLPSQVLYAKDAVILIPSLRQPPPNVTHPRPQVNGLRFPADTQWDEFLHRYYKPVADACIRVDAGCVDEVTIEVGDTVIVSGIGSSDSDGALMDDLPQSWYWDLDTTVDTGGPLPPYVVPPPGLIDDPCTEDCDRDEVDGASDDPDVMAPVFAFTCPFPLQLSFNLMVHDEHNDHAAVHNEESHHVHWKLDTDGVSITCVQPKRPVKVPRTPGPPELPPVELPPIDLIEHPPYDLRTVTPGSTFSYFIHVNANEALSGPMDNFAADPLPELVEFVQLGQCSFAHCEYFPDTRTVQAFGTISPGESQLMEIIVRVPIEAPPTCPPEIINTATVFDGVSEQTISTASPLVCPLTSGPISGR